MTRALIVVGDASETLDTFYPCLRLQEDGIEPVVCGRERRRYHTVMHEQPAGWDVTREWEGYTIEATVAFGDVDPADYAGVFFSGGRAPEYLRYDEPLLALTRAFFEAGKPVASICHGILIPARAGCLAGRRVATVPKCRHDVEVSGATFVDEACVVDGALVTGRTYHDHGLLMGAWVPLLAP